MCFPVVRVTGQDKEFLKSVKVELEYCNKHVNDMDENFLPVGQTLLFNSEYGVMLQSYKDAQGVYKWKNVTDGASGTLERVQKETVRITFCVKHFCR